MLPLNLGKHMSNTSAVAELKDLWKEEDAVVKTLLGEIIYFTYVLPLYS